jgi:hypothetical protein
MLIKPILITLLAVGAMLCFWSLRSRLMTRMLAMAMMGLGILFVVHPEFTNSIAHRLGVQRGADLMFYFFLVGAMYGFLILYMRQRTLQESLVKLTRSFALEHAIEPPSLDQRDELSGQ